MIRWDEEPDRLLLSATGRLADTSMSSTAKTSSALPGKVLIPSLLRPSGFNRLFCRFGRASSEPRAGERFSVPAGMRPCPPGGAERGVFGRRRRPLDVRLRRSPLVAHEQFTEFLGIEVNPGVLGACKKTLQAFSDWSLI